VQTKALVKNGCNNAPVAVQSLSQDPLDIMAHSRLIFPFGSRSGKTPSRSQPGHRNTKRAFFPGLIYFQNRKPEMPRKEVGCIRLVSLIQGGVKAE
jgi:hypothetical protein